jgi:hypothetical protein
MLGVLAALELVAQSRQAPPTSVPPPGPASQYQALARSHKAALWQMGKRPHSERESERLEEDFADRFLDMARQSPDNPSALRALMWIVGNSHAFSSRFEATRARAVSLLLQDHLQSAGLASLCQQLESLPSRASERLLVQILQHNPNPQVQAQACFSLVRHLKGLAEYARLLREQQQGSLSHFDGRLSEAFRKHIIDGNPARLEQRVKELLALGIARFPNARDQHDSFAKLARVESLEQDHLALGKVAPETEGPDLDGKWFKLSDYRGQVIVLVFWGEW